MITRPSAALSLIFWPHLACAVFIVLWLDGGAVSTPVVSLSSIVKIAVLGLWLIVSAARSPALLEGVALSAWPLGIMLLVSALYAPEIAQSGQYMQGFGYLLIAFTLACFYSQPRLCRERLVLMWVMIADLAITGIRTVVALQTDPELSRYLATTAERRTAVYGDQSFAGLGGYSFAYSLAAILIVLLYFLVRAQAKIALLAAVAVGLLVLIELGFTTAIVLALVLGGVFVVRDLVKRPELQILIVGAAIMGWISGLYLVALEALAGLSWVNADVGQRLIELSRFLSGGSTTGSDLGLRLYHWRNSVEIFFSSGPFGLAGTGALRQTTGAHSQWLDILASYGVWIGMLGLFLVFAWRRLSSRMTPSAVGALRRAWIYFIVLGVVNNLLFSNIVLTWMFLIPALAEWLAARAPSRRSTALEPVPT